MPWTLQQQCSTCCCPTCSPWETCLAQQHVQLQAALPPPMLLLPLQPLLHRTLLMLRQQRDKLQPRQQQHHLAHHLPLQLQELVQEQLLELRLQLRLLVPAAAVVLSPVVWEVQGSGLGLCLPSVKLKAVKPPQQLQQQTARQPLQEHLAAMLLLLLQLVAVPAGPLCRPLVLLGGVPLHLILVP